MKENKFPTNEELKNMSVEELTAYKITLNELSSEIDELIKKCDEILSK